MASKKVHALAAEAVKLQAKIDKLTAQRDDLRDALLPHLKAIAGDKQSASIGAPGGIVEYKRDEKFTILKTLATKNALTDITGDRFDEMFQQVCTIKIDQRAVKKVMTDPKDVLSVAIKEAGFIDFKESVSVKAN